MAVISAIDGITVSVSVDGEVLREYEDSDQEADGPLAGKTVLRYIECVSEKEYSIKIHIAPPFIPDSPNIGIYVKVDGIHATKFVLSRHRISQGALTQTVSGLEEAQPDGSLTIRKFRFASIIIIDDAELSRVEKDTQAISALGEITVNFFRYGFAKPSSATRITLQTPDTIREVAEKATKGRPLTHGTAFSSPISVIKRDMVQVNFLDGPHAPFAVFRFRYRSKVALQQLLLLPRTPTLDPVEGLSPEELQRLARQQLLIEAQSQVRAKTEKDLKREFDAVVEGNVKIENDKEHVSIDLTQDRPGAGQSFKKVKIQNGGMAIDLTED